MSTRYVELKSSTGALYTISEQSFQELPPGYTRASVLQGTWIFYAKKKFGSSSGSEYKIVEENHEEELPFEVQSGRMLNKGDNTIILFEHVQFCGKMKAYEKECKDLTDDFPTNPKGVSSIINWGPRGWVLYDNKNYQQPHYECPPKKYEFPSAWGGKNDTIKSIKLN